MIRGLLLAATLALSSAFASASTIGSFGSDTNTSDVTSAFMFTGTGTNDYSIDLAAGSYELDFAALLKTSLQGTINSVTFDGVSPFSFMGVWVDTNYTFSVAADNTPVSFHVATTPSAAVKFGPITLVPGGDASYLGMFTITDIGTPAVTAVPEPAEGALFVAGAAMLLLMAKRRKA